MKIVVVLALLATSALADTADNPMTACEGLSSGDSCEFAPPSGSSQTGLCTSSPDGTNTICDPSLSPTTGDCSSSPCSNGGTCSSGVTGFTCSCPDGYYGTTCDKSCGDNPCQNGGSCTDGGDDYYCACKSGYIGQNCEFEVCDECAYFVDEMAWSGAADGIDGNQGAFCDCFKYLDETHWESKDSKYSNCAYVCYAENSDSCSYEEDGLYMEMDVSACYDCCDPDNTDSNTCSTGYTVDRSGDTEVWYDSNNNKVHACAGKSNCAQYMTGHIQSITNHTYGRYDINLRTGHSEASGAGVDETKTCWTIMFLLTDHDYTSGHGRRDAAIGSHNEIAVCFDGEDTSSGKAVHFGTWAGEKSENLQYPGSSKIPSNFNHAKNYYTYTVFWHSDKIVFEIDGTYMAKTTEHVPTVSGHGALIVRPDKDSMTVSKFPVQLHAKWMKYSPDECQEDSDCDSYGSGWECYKGTDDDAKKVVYECACTSAFCRDTDSACNSNPCDSGATCLDIGEGGYRCACASGVSSCGGEDAFGDIDVTKDGDCTCEWWNCECQ